jgi:hypothetical protein
MVGRGKRVFLVSYGGAHSEALLPIIQEMAGRPELEVTVLGLTVAQPFFLDHGVSVFSLTEIFKLADLDSSTFMEQGQALIDRHGIAIHPSIPKDDSALYFGMGWQDLVQEHGQQEASRRFDLNGRKSFLPINICTALLQRLSPDVVISTSSPRFERAFISAASKLRLRSLVVVPAFVSEELVWLSEGNYADKLCVFHSRVKQDLIKAGRRSDDIVVTGNPAYEGLLSEVENLPVRSDTVFGKPRVLYLAQSERLPNSPSDLPDENAVMSGVIQSLGALERAGQCAPAVRFHPNQTEGERQTGIGIRVVQHDVSLAQCARDFDVVVTANSSAAVQLALAGLPVIEIGWSARAGTVPFASLGPTQRISNPEQLQSAIAQCMTTLHETSSKRVIPKESTASILRLAGLLP